MVAIGAIKVTGAHATVLETDGQIDTRMGRYGRVSRQALWCRSQRAGRA